MLTPPSTTELLRGDGLVFEWFEGADVDDFDVADAGGEEANEEPPPATVAPAHTTRS